MIFSGILILINKTVATIFTNFLTEFCTHSKPLFISAQDELLKSIVQTFLSGNKGKISGRDF